MAKLIISNGSDHDPAWAQSIVLSHDYTGAETLNPAAAIATGGMLLDGTTYYYKVVARMAEWIVEAGDSANQLSAWSFNSPHAFKAYWELTNSGTTRRVNIYSHANHDYLLAYGTRTNDGAIVLNQVNGSGITGAVTVAYTADDSGSDNTISYECDAVLGFDEVDATPAGTDLQVDLTWDAPLGVLTEYRVYVGTATGIYDYFFSVATNSYSHTGLPTETKHFDELIAKKRIANVKGIFIPATTANGSVKEARSLISLAIDWGESHPVEFNLQDITNQATWNLGTMAATHQAEVDINNWL